MLWSIRPGMILPGFESRCFPKTRDHAKDILKEMGLPFYDPLLIIEKQMGEWPVTSNGS